MKSCTEITVRQTSTTLNGARFKLTRIHCTFYLRWSQKHVVCLGRARCETIAMYIESEVLHRVCEFFDAATALHAANKTTALQLSEHDIQRAKRLANHFFQDTVEVRASLYMPDSRLPRFSPYYCLRPSLITEVH